MLIPCFCAKFICHLFSTDDQFSGENATVTGWGRYSIKSKKTSPILKEYTGPIANVTNCAKSWEKFPTITAYADKHLCLEVKMGTPCHVSVVICVTDTLLI